MRFRRTDNSTTAADPLSLRSTMLPSVWIGAFSSGSEWAGAVDGLREVTEIVDAIDDRMLASRHPTELTAWCAACSTVTSMTVHWHFGATEADGSVHPAWTETAGCASCGLNSRMRALVDFIATHPAAGDAEPCFAAEQVTASFPVFERLFTSVMGSEYLGPDREAGRTYPHSSGAEIRHEDLTALSFASGSFGTLITQDVFEHVPDHRRAFRECRRVLRPYGRLVFTVPFFPEAPHTEERAAAAADGTVTHLLPPEVHGNPLGAGSLCWRHFGWDILDELRAAGFATAAAHAYWGPWQGHLGFPFFVFEARSSA